MSQKATILDYALQIARAGVAGALAIAVGTAPDAAASIGFYADTTGAAEKLAMVVGGQTGPIYTRSGTDVNAAISGALSVTKQITSTLATGTAPLVIASTTVVANLNVSALLGSTWASPAAIGTGTPAAGTFTNITDSALTNGGVCIIGASGILAYDAGLTYDASADLLTVNHNGSALPAIPATDDTVIQVGGKDATTTRVLIDGFGGNPTFAGRMANGTNASKTAIVAGTLLVQLAGLGYDGSAYTTSSKASFQLQGLETWSGSQTGTKAILALTPAGTTTAVTALSVQPTLITQVCTDAVTAGATVVLALQHATSGTAAAGFGSTIQVQGMDDGATQRVMSQIITTWTDAATATRSSKIAFVTSVNASLVNALILSPTAATFQATDATTNTASTVANFTHVTSGTVANGFGTILQLSGPDDGGTQRAMAQISAKWTTAATATRSSQILFNVIVSAAQTTALSLNSTSAQFAAGFPLTTSDTTEASAIGTASVIHVGGVSIAKKTYHGDDLVFSAAADFQFDATTGSKLGTATSQKIGFWNATPIIQPAGATQAAMAAYVTGAFGLDSNANMQALYDLVAAMRTALVNTGIMKGAA